VHGPGTRERPVLVAWTPAEPGVRPGTRRYTPPVRHRVDYALARRAVLRELRAGTRTVNDVCDAHPELVRAGRYVGDDADHPCPVCGGSEVRYVSYVYGDGLKRVNGTCISSPDELARFGDRYDEFARYVVEVCIDCRWNHLHQRELHGRRYAAG